VGAFSEAIGVRNPDLVLFAEVPGGVGLRVHEPQALREPVARTLAERPRRPCPRSTATRSRDAAVDS